MSARGADVAPGVPGQPPSARRHAAPAADPTTRDHEQPEAATDAVEGPDAAGRPPRWPSWGDRALVGVVLVPFVVSAVALVIGADGFHPAGDLATSELAVRDIGRREVLTGLFSRVDWSHPGPMLWYLLWPVYRVTGSTGLGLALGALAINGASVVGIAVLARRRGGTALLVCTLLAVALLLRSLGGGFTANYWNPFVTTLPFALLVMLVWAMACRDRWALPVAAVVATFLAQTHVGFVPIGLGLLAWGVVAQVVATLADDGDTEDGAAEDGTPEDGAADVTATQGAAATEGDAGSGDGPHRRSRRGGAAALRPLVLPVTATIGLLALLWLPPVIDVLTNEPSNAGRTVAWFRYAEDAPHTLVEAWRVVSAQFAVSGEWLVGQEGPFGVFGGSPYVASAPAPVLLAVAALAGVALWRWSPRSGRHLVVVLVVTLAISVAAVARTLGPVYQYRLRWTWVAPVLALAAVLWAGWMAVDRRWPATARRALLPGLVVALVAVTAVDTVAAARVGRLAPEDSDVMEPLVAGTLDELEDSAVGPDDEVLVADPPGAPTWFPAGLLLALDQHGYDARAVPDRRAQLGDRWVTSGDPDVELVVASDRAALGLLEAPGELVASWSSVPLDAEGTETLRQTFAQLDALSTAYLAGEIGTDDYVDGVVDLEREVPVRGDMGARLVVVVRTR